MKNHIAKGHRSHMNSQPYDDGRMTEERISHICKQNGGFRTPELNDKLYLHFRGYSKIENIGAFFNCRALWLENNLLSEIGDGLAQLEKLNSLFLQHNSIRSFGITTPLLSLRSINLGFNHLTTLQGIEMLPSVEKLIVAHNSIEDISAVSVLPNLSVLDVSYNKLSDGCAVRQVVSKSKKLASLMLHGNDFVRSVKNYRKTIIVENGNLKYLDEHPVFDDERRCAIAFIKGGLDGERKERAVIRQEEADRQASQKLFFKGIVENAKKKREIEEVKPTQYFLDMQEDDDDIFVPTKKPPAAPKVTMRQGAHLPKPTVHHVDPAVAPFEAVFELSEGDILSLFQLDAAVCNSLHTVVRRDL